VSGGHPDHEATRRRPNAHLVNASNTLAQEELNMA
jgi:hypothetical protein